jgi:hypothetical protein
MYAFSSKQSPLRQKTKSWMTASSRRSTLIRRNPFQGKNGSQIFLEKRRLKTSIGLLFQRRLRGAQKPKPKTYDFSSDTASADAFAAKFENPRSGYCSCFVPIPSPKHDQKTTETIRPNTDVLCFLGKKGKMCRAQVYIRDLRAAPPERNYVLDASAAIRQCLSSD